MWPAPGLSLLVLTSVHVELLGPCVKCSCWLLLLLPFSSLAAVNVLILYFIYGPPRVFALCHGLSEVFQLLTKKLCCGTYSFGPDG